MQNRTEVKDYANKKGVPLYLSRDAAGQEQILFSGDADKSVGISTADLLKQLQDEITEKEKMLEQLDERIEKAEKLVTKPKLNCAYCKDKGVVVQGMTFATLPPTYESELVPCPICQLYAKVRSGARIDRN